MADRIPSRTIEGKVEGVYWAPHKTFVSEPLEVLNLTYEGIPGDRHSGLYRQSGPREHAQRTPAVDPVGRGKR